MGDKNSEIKESASCDFLVCIASLKEKRCGMPVKSGGNSRRVCFAVNWSVVFTNIKI